MYNPRNLGFVRRLLVNERLNYGRMSSNSSNNDDEVLTDFVNRNPRNMELLRLARKPQGYGLDISSINYYYRLNFESSQKHITGFVEHNKGTVVVSASTKEWCIRKHLYSSIDVAAAHNIGRILARRCLQSGIYQMHTELDKGAEKSKKLQVFLEAIKDGGITLGEPPQIRERESYDFIPFKTTCPWEVSEEYVEKTDKLYPPESLDKELGPPR